MTMANLRSNNDVSDAERRQLEAELATELIPGTEIMTE